MVFFSNFNFNFNINFGMKNWYMPSFRWFNFPMPRFIPSICPPIYNFRPISIFAPIPLVPIVPFVYNRYPLSTSPQRKTVEKKQNNSSTHANKKHTTNYNSPKINKTKRTQKIDNSYVSLTKTQAAQKASEDKNLERLNGGKNWSIAQNSFITDIPYAKKGTGAILDKVSEMLGGENLVITSALATGEAGNPHKKSGYDSHHNAENPKLDIRLNGNAYDMAARLRSTGYFSRVDVEKDHLDVQIDPAKYERFSALA